MIKINSLIDLMYHRYCEKDIPENVYEDISKRLYDWFESDGDIKIHKWVKDGGEATDDYIRKQFDYAEYFLNKDDDMSRVDELAIDYVMDLVRDIKIVDYPGTWNVIDSCMRKDGEFLLLENDKHGNDYNCIITDDKFNIIVEDVWNGLDELPETISYIK